MPSTLKQFAIRNLEVKGLAKFVASAIRISSRVGAPTRYSVTCLPAVGSKEMVTLNADPMGYVTRIAQAAQKLARSSRVAPDTAFFLDIGTQSASVQCRLASAEPTIARGELAVQLNLLHPSSILSAFDTSIYQRIGPTSLFEAGELALLHVVKVNDGDLLKMISLTLDKWKADFESSIVLDSAESQSFYRATHARNQTILSQVKSALGLGGALGLGAESLVIKSLTNLTPAEYVKVMQSIHQALTSPGTLGAAFFNQDGMRYDFGTVLSCGIPASQCGLIQMDDFVSNRVVTMPVNLAKSTMRFGDDTALPVGQVYCDLSSETIKTDLIGKFVARSSVVTYPNGIAPTGTQVVKLNPPPWLQNAKYITPRVGSFKRSIPGLKVESKLTEWLRTNYRYQTLATSGGTLTAPLMFWPRPGTTYKVIGAETKTELFTGFLVAANHDVSLASGGQGNAKTTLEFSHIRTPGFTLD